ncbi:MAG TPA: C40 family peptidase [Rhodocyclaceae bacterium]
MPRRPALSATKGFALGSALALAGCGLLPSSSPPRQPVASEAPAISPKAEDVVMFALGLIETGYRFGGKNPEAGLDCSGMVSYVFDKAANVKLRGSAADIARQGRPVDMASLRPGDLVFFNTRHHPYSHVGIYIGDGRFVHAPSSGGKVRTESLKSGWFAARFEEARTYLE